jgi:hypothetical protein
LFKKLKQEVCCLFPLGSFVQEVEVRSLLSRGPRTWTKPWYRLLDSSLGYILVFQLSKVEVGIIAQKECSPWVCALILQPAFWGAGTCVSVCIYVCSNGYNLSTLQNSNLMSYIHYCGFSEGGWCCLYIATAHISRNCCISVAHALW